MNGRAEISTNNQKQCNSRCYVVVKLIGNRVELYNVFAETANTAIIKAKYLRKPLETFESESNYYGEGMFAIIESEISYKSFYDLKRLFRIITPEYEKYFS